MTDGETTQQQAFVPRAVGSYRIEEELGSGAMGAVFRAVHARLDRAVALKVMRPDLLQDADSVRRFLREARSIAKLEHPNIVAVYDAGEVDGIYYIAMKLLQGETLQSLMARQGPLPPDVAISIAQQLCRALDYAHRQGVVHRDVKPANVMIDRGVITLTDFSIAQALNPGATRSVTISGTPLYMSPEQIRGHASDSRSDIYGVGVLLHEMLTGRPPYEGQMVSVMYSHLHDPIPDARATIPATPEALVAVIQRAMAKEPENRFQTAGEMLDALERVRTDTDLAPAGPAAVGARAGPDVVLPNGPSSQATEVLTAAPPLHPPPAVAKKEVERNRKPALFGGIGIVVAAIVAGLAFFLRGQSPATAALVVTSQPAGASISIDGKPRGPAPLDLHGLSAGKHVISASSPTYLGLTRTVDLKGGAHAAVNLALSSWPLSRLIAIDRALLTFSYTKDPGTGRWVVGAPLTAARAGSVAGRPINAVAEFRVTPALPQGRILNLRPSYSLYGPGGTPLGSFPPAAPVLKMDHGHSVAVFGSGFRLTPRGQATLPSGTYHVQLLVGGQVMKTLSLVLT